MCDTTLRILGLDIYVLIRDRTNHLRQVHVELPVGCVRPADEIIRTVASVTDLAEHEVREALLDAVLEAQLR